MRVEWSSCTEQAESQPHSIHAVFYPETSIGGCPRWGVEKGDLAGVPVLTDAITVRCLSIIVHLA